MIWRNIQPINMVFAEYLIENGLYFVRCLGVYGTFPWQNDQNQNTYLILDQHEGLFECNDRAKSWRMAARALNK